MAEPGRISAQEWRFAKHIITMGTSRFKIPEPNA